VVLTSVYNNLHVVSSLRYIVTTFLTGIKEPIITYTNDMLPGLYMCDGLVMCVKENDAH
jgi:hypothetical protein